MSNLASWEKIRNENPDGKLMFIHTPKCGGSYVSKILRDLNIHNKGHHPASKNEYIHFTVIRDPIDRFQSLLNYRLGEKTPRYDWPNQLCYAYNDTNVTLNELVSKMSDNEIVGFRPFSTLTFWTTNIDIIITIDQLYELLHFFGYTYEKDTYRPINVSVKIRGDFNDETRNRIAILYNDDVLLFNKIHCLKG